MRRTAQSLRTWSSRLAVLPCLALMQCATAPPQPMPAHWMCDDAAILERVEPEFRSGLDRLAAEQQWPLSVKDGDYDWVLLGVRVQWDDQERVWFVRVAEVMDPREAAGGKPLRERRFSYTLPLGVGESIKPSTKFAVRCRRVSVETYDESGEFINAASHLSPEVFPQSSLYQALAALPQMEPPSADDATTALGALSDSGAAVQPSESQRQIDEGLFRVIAALQAMGVTQPVQPIREAIKDHVIETPSLLGLLLAALRPTLTTTLSSAAPLQFPWMLDRLTLPAYQAQFALSLADEPFFDCHVITGPCVPPCHLIGGVLMIEASNPNNRDHRLVVRVLASSRANPAAAGG